MEKQIRDIISYYCGGTHENKQIATKQILDLFNVSKRYSLNYLDRNGKEQKVKLWAESEDKALDKLGETEPKATYIFISKI